MLILSSVGCCSMTLFIIYVTICFWLLRAHTLTSRHAHHHYHMFKQQVPYVALPLALGEPRDHILLSHTHHHPGLTDHSQTDGPWWLLGLCLRWPAWNLMERKVNNNWLGLLWFCLAIDSFWNSPFPSAAVWESPAQAHSALSPSHAC